MKMKRWSVSLLLLLTITAAAQKPSKAERYLRSQMPQEWGAMSEGNLNMDEQLFQQTLPVEDEWWKVFGDPMLDSLITVAVDQSFDVLMAIDRMNMAKYSMRIARSNFFPTLTFGAGWTKEQTSGKFSAEPQGREEYYDATLSASWEIDVFGRIRSQARAEKELFYASKEDYTSTMISLAAQVASAYINLRAAQQELIVIQKNCEEQGVVVKITEARFNAGLASKLDVAQAKSTYYSTKASIPATELGIVQYMNTIAILLGVYPQQVKSILSEVRPLPEYMEAVGVGIPVGMICRRPDIRAAYRDVRAQAAKVGAARADFAPTIAVNGSVGYMAKDLKDFFNHKAFTYEIAPALSWTIFQGGSIINSMKSAKADLDQVINQYNQTVLTAVQETDNAMEGYKSYIKQVLELRETCYQYQEALNLSLNLYKEGLSPFQNVVDAQKSLLTYQSQLVQAKGNCLIQLITLYKALGGGWKN